MSKQSKGTTVILDIIEIDIRKNESGEDWKELYMFTYTVLYNPYFLLICLLV